MSIDCVAEEGERGVTTTTITIATRGPLPLLPPIPSAPKLMETLPNTRERERQVQRDRPITSLHPSATSHATPRQLKSLHHVGKTAVRINSKGGENRKERKGNGVGIHLF